MKIKKLLLNILFVIGLMLMVVGGYGFEYGTHNGMAKLCIASVISFLAGFGISLPILLMEKKDS